VTISSMFVLDQVAWSAINFSKRLAHIHWSAS
jgi:hypothetical protein